MSSYPFWPNADDYRQAIAKFPEMVADDELRLGQPLLNSRRKAMLWSGNFAAVFRIHCPATGNDWALKCFTREVPGLQERYRQIAAHLDQARLPFTVDFRYLAQGVCVRGHWFPALKMRWVEGLRLNQFVEEHLQGPRNLKMLLELWVKLAVRLREAKMAHADLQHGNVLLVPQDHGALALRLIDYDGMYVPSLAGTRSAELGHPAYQHPQRLREGTYNGELDRFSHLVIYTSVRCLSVGQRESWRQFNNGDNLLFRESDFTAPGRSPALRAFWESADRDVHALVGRLALACGQRLEEVPWLHQVVDGGQAVPLTRGEEREAAALLAASAQVPAIQPIGGSAPAAEPPLIIAETVPEPPTTDTRPATAAGTVPATPPLPSRAGAVGRSLLRGFAAAARGFDTVLRRLVGEENDVLRYFLWVALPLLLLAAVWAGILALTPSPPPWKLQLIAARTIEAGNSLKARATVENSEAWKGKVRYSLGPQHPAGTTIDSQTGELAWTPPLDQAAGKYDFTVSAETSDGRHDETTLMVTVTAPVSFKLKPVEPQTVEAGKPLSVGMAMENAEVWKGKVRYSLGSPTPLGMGIDASTGIFAWTPIEDQAADKHKVTVLATGADGRRDETSFVVNVLRPMPPLKLKPVPAQTVEAGKPLQLAVTLENPDAWQGKVRYAIASLAFPGARIDPESGRFSWTPPQDQAAGQQEISVSATGREGQTTQTSFIVTVTRPIPVHPPAALADKGIAVDLGNGVKLEMVLIPAGEFLMGTPGNSGNEQQHRVRITRPFYLGKYFVTQEQWEAAMGSNPSYFKGPQNPVENVSWDDCQQFFNKLNAKSGPGRGKFQLPSEAQWEYACRAGSTTRYCFGDEESGLGEYGWYNANSGNTTHPVGEKKPNAWGLYDMHGNVWEWCQDWYGGGYYATSPMDDPAGPATGSFRVLRGGSWIIFAGFCESAHRDYRGPAPRIHDLGFRASQVPAAELKLRPVGPQSVEVGKPLQLTAALENAAAWQGKVSYSLGPKPPPGATIDAQSGVFTWTPPLAEPAGQQEISVSATGREGQTTRTSFIVTVTRPIPVPPPATLAGKETSVDLGNGVKLEMVLIPAGEFLMGSPDADKDGQIGEQPQHRVRISKPFYLGKYLVMQEQWQAVMGNNPSQFKGPKNPVEQVSWDDCQQFLEKLSAKVGGGKFRLPTEAQWEYACRAGRTTRYGFGDEESGLGEYAWYDANSGNTTHPVGEKKANAWGLYDMHGNVWEWCADWYNWGYYAKSPTDDPTGPAAGSRRVLRGGHWSFVAWGCRSARRFDFGPGIRGSFLGLRVSRVVADK